MGICISLKALVIFLIKLFRGKATNQEKQFLFDSKETAKIDYQNNIGVTFSAEIGGDEVDGLHDLDVDDTDGVGRFRRLGTVAKSDSRRAPMTPKHFPAQNFRRHGNENETLQFKLKPSSGR